MVAKSTTSLTFRVNRACHPIKDDDGSIPYVAVNARDLTEEHVALLDRQRICNVSLDMLCIASLDGYFKEVNPSWTLILGWRAE